MKKWLNYHHLYYFHTIAQEGGVAKAAEKLRLGQPTLSTQLKQLEEVVGHRLFERTTRSIALTEPGKIALNYANEIFRLGDEMLQVMEDKTFTSRINLQVGVLDSIPKTLVLRLSEMALATGRCSLSLLEGNGSDLLRNLLAHQLDILISDYSPASVDGRTLYSRSLGKLPVSIYGSESFKSLRKGFPGSLNQQPFVLPTWHSKLRHDIEHCLKSNSIQVKVAADTQDVMLQKMMGVRGVGLIPIPDFAAEELVAEKKIFKIGSLPEVHQEFWLVSASRRIENPIASKLMKEFQL